MHCLKEFVAYCFGHQRELVPEMLEKLEGGTPLHGFSEDPRLDAMAIEGLNVFGKLRDDMDKALKSEDCIPLSFLNRLKNDFEFNK